MRFLGEKCLGVVGLCISIQLSRVTRLRIGLSQSSGEIKPKKIGIDGTAEAIKEAIKSSFMLRTKRPFWLEDENGIVRPVDRYMPLRNYTLHVDEGLTIKVCMSEESDDLPVQTEDKTFYSEDDFYDFLSRRDWTRLRENNGYWNIDRMDELCPGAVYRGVSLMERVQQSDPQV